MRQVNPEATVPELRIATRELIKGRSNAKGTVTLTHDGVSTSMVVRQPGVIGPESSIFLMPMTADAAAAVPTTWISNVQADQFTINFTATSNVDMVFMWGVVG